MDAITQTRIGALYPELARRWTVADQMLTSLGFDIRVSQGLRTWPAQSALYAEGRNPDGSYIDPVHQKGVVTHAKAGESWHNYGLALDGVPMENGQPIWDETHPAYAKMIEVAESVGLVSGSHWAGVKKDSPHFQLTGNFPENAPDANCRYLFAEGGLKAVWDQVDKDLGVSPR